MTYVLISPMGKYYAGIEYHIIRQVNNMNGAAKFGDEVEARARAKYLFDHTGMWFELVPYNPENKENDNPVSTLRE